MLFVTKSLENKKRYFIYINIFKFYNNKKKAIIFLNSILIIVIIVFVLHGEQHVINEINITY